MNVRVTLPSKFSVAEYWLSGRHQDRLGFPSTEFVSDIDYPACFACGLHLPAWVVPTSYRLRWNKSALHRCHIVPRSLGDADNPSNLVLMCASCHRDAPDHTDENVLFNWMFRRQSADGMKPFATELMALGVSVEELVQVMAADIERWRKVSEEEMGKAGSHYGLGLKPTASAAVYYATYMRLKDGSSFRGSPFEAALRIYQALDR